ncbi:hypothetical protein [Planctellipticum variicoloris]|uniref:hypothetical protein n=1 Tax=Planctellipticum variicoloris TaxID=3064265 RepID=UPI00301359DE|nr:hypothetical protein SH412_000310 [Planctomycetaceae bacterium SH412]
MHDLFSQFLAWFVRFAIVAGGALLVVHLAVGRADRTTGAARVDRDPLLRRRVRGALTCVAAGAFVAFLSLRAPAGLPGWALAGIVLAGGLAGLVVFGRKPPVTQEQTPGLASILERTAIRLAAGWELEPALADACSKAGVPTPDSLIGPRWLAWLRDVDADRTGPPELRDGFDFPAEVDRAAIVWRCAVAVRQRDAEAVLARAKQLSAEARRPWLWCVAPAVYVWFLGPAIIELAGFWQRVPAAAVRAGDVDLDHSAGGSAPPPGCATCQTGPAQP